MRVLVAFKVTPDYEALRDADWAAGAAAGVVAAPYVRRVLDVFDESALELALRLRDSMGASGASAELGAVAVGGREAEPYLATLAALGYQPAARIDMGTALDFAPAATARLLAAYIRHGEAPDLVLLGYRSAPEDGGTLPFQLAEELGWPCLTEVTTMEPRDGGRVRARCTLEDAELNVSVRPPCVLAVGNALVSHLRVPTLADRLAQRGFKPGVVTPQELGRDETAALDAPDPALIGLERVDRSRAGTVVTGATPAEKARALAAHLRDLVDAR